MITNGDSSNRNVIVGEIKSDILAGEIESGFLVGEVSIGGGTQTGMTVIVLDQSEYDLMEEHFNDVLYLIRG